MSRRSFPRINPADLRDHADDARVERVWERLEQDLPALDHLAPRRRSGLMYLAVAAAIAAFGGGVLLGRKVGPARPAMAAVPMTNESSSGEVLAAGSKQRDFELGGVKLTLLPGAVIEKDHAGADGTRVSLLQGEVWLESGEGARALSLSAGEATLATQAGSAMRVKHNREAMDVDVTAGSVTLTAPGGSARQLAKGDRLDAVPLRKVVAIAPVNAVEQRAPVLPQRPKLLVASRPKSPGMPDWLARYIDRDYDGSFALLSKRGIQSTIDSAKSAYELNMIAELMTAKKEPAFAQRALTRLVEKFSGDQRAYLAARDLAKLYEKSGQSDLARDYSNKADQLAAGEDSLDCNRTRERILKSPENNAEAAQAINDYLNHHKDGQCREDFEALLQSFRSAAAPGEPAPALAAPVDPPK